MSQFTGTLRKKLARRYIGVQSKGRKEEPLMKLSGLFFIFVILFSGCVMPVRIPETKVVEDVKDSPSLCVDVNSMNFRRIEIYSKTGEPIDDVEVVISFKEAENPDSVAECRVRLDKSDASFEEIGAYFRVRDNVPVVAIPIFIYPQELFYAMRENFLGVVPSSERKNKIILGVSFPELAERRDDLEVAFCYKEMNFLPKLYAYLVGVDLGSFYFRYKGVSLEECVHLWNGNPPPADIDDAALCYNVHNCIFKNKKYSYCDILNNKDATTLYFFKNGGENAIDFPASTNDTSVVNKFDEKLPSHIKRWGIVPNRQKRILFDK